MSGILIIGSGLAGYNLAREIRRRDAKAVITMVTSANGDSFSRPMLSMALSHGQSPESLVLASMESQARFLNMRIYPRTQLEAILPTERQVVCGRKLKLDYTSLIMATGAKPLPVPLPIEAQCLAHQVNDLDGFRAWSETLTKLARPTPVAILGAGHVALEFACELVALGFEPHLVAPDPWPLSRYVPEVIGEDLRQGLQQCGVAFHLGTTAVSLERRNDKAKSKVTPYMDLVLSSGETVVVGAVLSAVGTEPDLFVARQAGLATRRGILVDNLLRSSLRDIYALGDVAEVEGCYTPYVGSMILEAKTLAGVLVGTPAPMMLPLPVVQLKCPLHPVTFCTPPVGVQCDWEYESDSRGVSALCYNERGDLVGFALTRERVHERSMVQSGLALA